MSKKILSFILITLTVALTACGGKDAKESTAESKKAESKLEESASASESESAQEPEVKDTKLYDWNSILELPDPIPAEDNPENRMAHNIYVDPNLSQTSGQYTGFLIDFCTDCTANCTYWALCNWRMDTSELESEYTLKNTGGAYAGLQNTEEGKRRSCRFGRSAMMTRTEMK